jgi:hypothetical protein
MGSAIEGYRHFNVVNWVGLPTPLADLPGDPVGDKSNGNIRRGQPIVKKTYYFKSEIALMTLSQMP